VNPAWHEFARVGGAHLELQGFGMRREQAKGQHGQKHYSHGFRLSNRLHI
jgi:hypothetical protein